MAMSSFPFRAVLFLNLTGLAVLLMIYYIHSVDRFTKRNIKVDSFLFAYGNLPLDHSNEAITYFENVMYEHDPFYNKSTSYTAASPNIDIQPKYRGLKEMCSSKSQPLRCPSNKFGKCIKISLVGLCGHWNTVGLLRELPAEISSCGTPRNISIVIDHAATASAISTSDIVVFLFVNNYLNMNVWQSLRYFKPAGQMWVFQTEESPYYAIGLLPPWIYRNDSFDISNTYRTSADIYSPYGYFEPFRTEESNQVGNISAIIENKSRFMIWISSHCETLQWDRTKFARDLQKIMKVDIFGRCGNDTLCKCRWQQNCRNEVDDFVRTYKFSLALENSCCEDYITEKLWHTYSVGNIPVVVGPKIQNYEKLVPPGSFIHADQFKSIHDLKKYLEYLDRNDTAYLEYFQWKTVGKISEHSIKDHFQSHLSNPVMCSIVNKYTERQDMARKHNDGGRGKLDHGVKMFDPYGPEWKGTCHSCGDNKWIKDYEYPPGHKRQEEWIWAR